MQSKTLVAAGTAVAALCLAGCGSSSDAKSSSSSEPTEDWFPTAVTVWPEQGFDSESTETEYSPTEDVSKAWNICASFPHLADPYWLAVDYGVIKEAERAGVNMDVVEAGGYGNLDKQIQQVEDCAQNNDAVILGAISTDGLNPTIEKLKSEGKVVIDFINGVNSPSTDAQSVVSYREIAAQTAQYLVDNTDGEDVTVAWFPGPKGAGFAEGANQGFTETLEGTNVEVVNIQWGNTDKESQTKLIEDALAANPDVDFIAGNAVAAEAAGPILRDRDLTDTIGVLSYYMTPGTYQGIQTGSVLAAAADPAVLTARVATDLAIRALEGQEHEMHVAPALLVIDKEALETWDSTTTLAPDDWSAKFSYTAN